MGPRVRKSHLSPGLRPPQNSENLSGFLAWPTHIFCRNLSDLAGLTKSRHGYERKRNIKYVVIFFSIGHFRQTLRACPDEKLSKGGLGNYAIMSYPVSPHFPRTYIYTLFFSLTSSSHLGAQTKVLYILIS